MNRKTVGALAIEVASVPPETRDPIELQREMQKSYEDNIIDALERGKKTISGDFFVCVLTKKEKLLNNVLRNYFFPTQACPTPTWDQTIYHYYSADDRLEFLWVIPSKDTCELFQDNALDIVPQEKELLRFVLDFHDGTLLRLAKKLNKEGE